MLPLIVLSTAHACEGGVHRPRHTDFQPLSCLCLPHSLALWLLPPPQSCVCSVKVTAGQFLYIVVSGAKAGDAGAFTLDLENTALATVGTNAGNAIDLGSGPAVSQSGDSSAYLDTSLLGNGTCHTPDSYDNKTIGDGGDVVRAWVVGGCACVRVGDGGCRGVEGGEW